MSNLNHLEGKIIADIIKEQKPRSYKELDLILREMEEDIFGEEQE